MQSLLFYCQESHIPSETKTLPELRYVGAKPVPRSGWSVQSNVECWYWLSRSLLKYCWRWGNSINPENWPHTTTSYLNSSSSKFFPNAFWHNYSFQGMLEGQVMKDANNKKDVYYNRNKDQYCKDFHEEERCNDFSILIGRNSKM